MDEQHSMFLDELNNAIVVVRDNPCSDAYAELEALRRLFIGMFTTIKEDESDGGQG